MNIYQIFQLLALRRKLRKHESLTRKELENYQLKALNNLREYAYANSSFYKKFHKGMTDKPLNELPILTKAQLMENWDEIVTDQSVKLKDVENFLANLPEDQIGALFRDKYYVASTAGTSGLKGIFIYNWDEWLNVLVSYMRSDDWTGVDIGLTKRLRLAVVGSKAPWHQSGLVGVTLKGFLPSMIVDVNEKMEVITAQLNEFQPELLGAFSGMAKSLAQEQIKGSLNISPKAVFCTFEVLTDEARRLIEKAWGVQPFNIYAATETAGIASECSDHNGLHIYEDLIITEVVDENNNPVKPGEYGKKLLVTILFTRTVPLIRYEISDSVSLSANKCTCKCNFTMIEHIQGRTADIIHLKGQNGDIIAIQPVFFDEIMDSSPVISWQIVQDPDNIIRVLISDYEPDFNEANFIETMKHELEKLEVDNPFVQVEYVKALSKSALGKTILIKALT